jgi:hypothetical protein
VIEERRAALGPDLPVRVRRLRRARAQDDGVEQQPSPDRVDVEDARVREELGEVATDRAGGRRVGGAEVEEEESGQR